MFYINSIDIYLDDVVVAESEPGRNHLLLHHLLHGLVPVSQTSLQHSLSLIDGETLDVDLLCQELVRGSAHMLVNVSGPGDDKNDLISNK